MNRFFLPIFLMLFLGGSAQKYYDDAQVWAHIYIQKKIGKKFLVHLNQKNRWTNNVSWLGLAYADLGITYRITENIKIQADYVFAQKRRSSGYFNTRHRLYTALILKKDLRRWRFSYRNLFQVNYLDPYTSEEGYIPRLYDRSKITVRYEASKRFLFYASEELYFPLNSPAIIGPDRSRSSIGMLINITKNQQLELYFIYQQQLQKNNWYDQKDYYPNYMLKRYFIYGIGYAISL